MNTSPAYLAEQGLSNNFPKRFICKVSVGDDCWEWCGSKDSSHYGMIKSKGTKNVKAHRASDVVFISPIPTDMQVLHKCDNPGCVNPKHLFLGTHKDNMRDMAEKGRHNTKYGEQAPHVRLNWEKVSEIRLRYANGETQEVVAAAFGINHADVSRIVLNKRWKLEHAPKVIG